MIDLEKIKDGRRILVDPKEEGAVMAHILSTVPDRWKRDPDLPVLHRRHGTSSHDPDATELFTFEDRQELQAFLRDYDLDEQIGRDPLPDHARLVLEDRDGTRTDESEAAGKTGYDPLGGFRL